MSTENRKDRIIRSVQAFKEKAEQYSLIKSQIDEYVEAVQSKNEELSKVAYEERIKELAEEALFPDEPKHKSQAGDIEEEIKSLQVKLTSSHDRLNEIKMELTQGMYSLPIPVDLDKCRREETRIIFPFFNGVELGETAISVMRELLKMERLEFQGVEIISDKVVVESSSRNEAITKLASGIKAYRLKLGVILKAYEQIDEMVEKAMKSNLYPRILKILLIEKKMSTADIAKKLGENERKVYDACYNLTRDRWTPNPLNSTNSGEWILTVSGEILANRLLEKYPEKTEFPETTQSTSTSYGSSGR